jgi:hypothetical protein
MAAHGSAQHSGAELRPLHIGHRIRRMSAATAYEWVRYEDTPWIGFVAVPAAMMATGLLDQWWSWPILLVEAAVSTRSERWSWVLTLELGYVGTAWAFVGADALGSWPTFVLPIGVVWAAFPALLAGAVAHHRHQPIFGGFRRPTSGSR